MEDFVILILVDLIYKCIIYILLDCCWKIVFFKYRKMLLFIFYILLYGSLVIIELKMLKEMLI